MVGNPLPQVYRPQLICSGPNYGARLLLHGLLS
jgi:hypothetical protein